MPTMSEYFFCNYLWGVIYSIGNVIIKIFFANITLPIL